MIKIQPRFKNDVIIFDIEGEIKRSDITDVTLHQLVKEQLDSERRRAKGPEPEAKVGFRDALETTRQNSYLKLLAGIMAATLIVSTLLDFQFNSVVHKTVQGGAAWRLFLAILTPGPWLLPSFSSFC